LKLTDINLPALNGVREITGQKTAYLRLKLEPTCNVNTSVPRIGVNFSGKRPCGENINTGEKVYYSSYLPLSGMSSSLPVEVQNPVIATTDFICHQSDTLLVKFRKTTDPTVSVAVTDSVAIIVPKALHLKDATSIVYSLPEGGGESSVPAQSGTVDPSTIRARIDGDTCVIAWLLPKGYCDALQSGDGSGTLQSEYNEYKICLQMDDPEDYFDGNIRAGIITGASLKAGFCPNTSVLTEVHAIANIITRATHTTWNGTDNDWNNTANWLDGIPGKCSDVTVNFSSKYPELIGTIRIDSIHFDAHTEIGKVPWLNYNKATTALEILSNQWYLLSAPLKDMYSGDYILYHNNRFVPIAYMCMYQSEDHWTGAEKKVAEWTASFGAANIPLSPGSGYAVWIDRDPTGSQVAFDFPKDSMSYVIYNQQGTEIIWTDHIPSNGRNNNRRFIYDDKFSQTSDKNNRAFDLPVENGSDVLYTNLLILRLGWQFVQGNGSHCPE
jgi:hypothetical protein